MTRQALVLMTALVPTTGHGELIDFASQLEDTQVNVLIMGRSFEPVPLQARYLAVSQQFTSETNVRVRAVENDEAPQNPDDVEGFWPWWRRQINKVFPEVSSWDFVVASEHYGLLLAQTLDADFIPYDIDRSLNPVSGTMVRENIREQWANVLPSFKQELQFTATLFGQESVGKTTLTEAVSRQLGASSIFEYARPYQEFMGPEVNENVMAAIHLGQSALQRQTKRAAFTAISIQDTDLFSTVGYWHIMGCNPPQNLETDARELASDVYYLLPDDAPFVADPLRYGGNERESTQEFWEEILESYSLPYVIVPPGTLSSKRDFIARDLLARADASWLAIKEFKRE